MRLDVAKKMLDGRDPRVRARMDAMGTHDPLFNIVRIARESGEFYDELWYLLERTEEIRAKIAAAEAAVTLESIPIEEIRAMRIHCEPDVLPSGPEDANEAQRESWYRQYILTRKHGGNDPNLWENRYRPVDFACAARSMGWSIPYMGPLDYIADPDRGSQLDLTEESAALAKRERGIMQRETWVARRENWYRAARDDTERLYAHLKDGGGLRTLSESMEVNTWRPHDW